MKKATPTLLMKELKFLRGEAERIHREDLERSFAPLNENMEFKYDTGYSYSKNREALREIHQREFHIRSVLARFNSIKVVDGFDFTITEALVRIGQLKDEVKVLTALANRSEYTETTVSGNRNGQTVTNKINYDQNRAIIDLKEAQQELSALQIAVDKTNLTTLVEC